MEANLLLAAATGIAGALAMTVAVYLFKAVGINLDIPYLLGSRFFPLNRSSAIFISGNLLHLMLGALWGVVYVFLLTAMQVTPNWPSGILFGFAHGIFIGVMIGTLSESHPYIGPEKPISDPGMFAQQWGTAVPYLLFGLHILYGVVSMALYHRFLSG